MKDMTPIHPVYLGWQVDWPLFVKIPFSSGGRNWIKGEEFKWAELGVDQDRVAKLYSISYVHHNPELEKQNKVGDRLHEMDEGQLKTLVNLLNAELKSRTVSTKDYQEKRCRQSRISMKQRGLIRRFLYSNKWCEEFFYETRDKILGKD
jgi:hypothetical protein